MRKLELRRGGAISFSGGFTNRRVTGKSKTKQRRALEILDTAHKLGPFRTPEEIDRQIREERDSWDD